MLNIIFHRKANTVLVNVFKASERQTLCFGERFTSVNNQKKVKKIKQFHAPHDSNSRHLTWEAIIYSTDLKDLVYRVFGKDYPLYVHLASKNVDHFFGTDP